MWTIFKTLCLQAKVSRIFAPKLTVIQITFITEGKHSELWKRHQQDGEKEFLAHIPSQKRWFDQQPPHKNNLARTKCSQLGVEAERRNKGICTEEGIRDRFTVPSSPLSQTQTAQHAERHLLRVRRRLKWGPDFTTDSRARSTSSTRRLSWTQIPGPPQNEVICLGHRHQTQATGPRSLFCPRGPRIHASHDGSKPPSLPTFWPVASNLVRKWRNKALPESQEFLYAPSQSITTKIITLLSSNVIA